MMNTKMRCGLLVGAGFLLGTVGTKILTSPQAKKCYVQGVAGALKAKACYEGVVEQAKAQVDDIVAEATTYIEAEAAPSDAEAEKAAE